ncbi:hypothetical protein GOV05_03115 [Candidatus Woesearchaeota archaeon]|nr:hypothetical protein [Candidatus Woesearchaeota archaeon]
MVNQFNKPEYFLFFGSNNIKGLEVMKEAMWKVDDMGDFQFSDYTYNIKQQQEGIQTVLFEKTPNYSILKKQIIEEFKGKTVDIAHIENFVISETAFLRKHIRMPVLDKLEYDDKPIIKVNYSGKKRRRGAYPSGCKIQF